MATEGSGRSEGVVGKIVVAVVIALLAGGSSPWWWNKIFPVNPPAVQTAPPQVSPASPPQPYMGELQYRTNLQGSDISNFNKSEINTEGECSNLCQQNPQCKAMTFVQTPPNGGVCWLKDAVPQASAAENMVSAVKIFPPQ